MSLQNMNQMRLVPKKDYVANRLVSGALQLARNTSLFLDETQLEQGQLDTTGEARRRWCTERINKAVNALQPVDIVIVTLTRLDLPLRVLVYVV